LVKSSRAYKSTKRNKELQRLKKREEKRLRRLAKDKPGEGEPETGEPAAGEPTTGE
jgi:hypothetical protein